VCATAVRFASEPTMSATSNREVRLQLEPSIAQGWHVWPISRQQAWRMAGVSSKRSVYDYEVVYKKRIVL
jgi:hypothetical protein